MTASCRAFMLCLCLFTGISTFAYTAKIDGIYYDLVGDHAYVTYQHYYANSDLHTSDYSGSVVIPSTVIYNSKTYNVISISGYAFSGCSGLTSVCIPNSVTSISEYAFQNCSALTSITIPKSVRGFGYKVFSGCTSLTSVTLYANDIVSKTYTSYLDEDGLAYIFGSQVTDYILGDNITSIGDYAFYGCSRLKSVTIPESVTSIGEGAFRFCGLTKAEFASIESLCRISFKDFDSNPLCHAKHLYINGQEITDLVIPNSVKSIGDYAFGYCSGLTSVTIPNSVTSIGNYAFYGCSGLTSVTIPNSVTSIGESAFRGCSGLTKAEFASIESLCKIKFGGTYYSNPLYYAHHLYINGQEVTDVVIPNSVTSIGIYAFPSTTKIYINKGISLLIALWELGINPFDLSTNTCLKPPLNSRIHSNSSKIALLGNIPMNVIKMENESLTIDGVTKTGQTASFNGLTPNKSYQVQYNATITYGDGSYTYNKKDYIYTEALTLTTSQPKVISVGNAVVGAISNIDDAEENVGFEWRRTDWTDDFASNTGVAYLYEGTMEGYIRNLYTEKLWKVRPYYQDNTGKYYYGEWVGLDPTNTSYFEPTVHTYARIDQTEDKVQISGYVQRGTDAVSKQGFKYWVQEDNGNARGAGISIPSGAKTVEAEGRVMEVELTGLKPNTTYAYVAFVTTTEGETFYGKQLSFTTGDDPEASVTGDANGNGVVEIGDVTSVLTLMATPEATGYNNKAADANGNGEIEIGDVTTILTIMAGN